MIGLRDSNTHSNMPRRRRSASSGKENGEEAGNTINDVVPDDVLG